MKIKYVYLWLTFRLMKKQKLRTLTVFCAVSFSVFLLSSFGRAGYGFWMQVHEGASETTQYDFTQWVLTALVAVLAMLVVLCSVILLHNLFSLTFVQKRHSLGRLLTLGAAGGDLVFMAAAEISMIFCAAAPLGEAGAFLLEKWTGVPSGFPAWMTAGVLIWVFLVSCICGVGPVLKAIRSPLACGGGKYRKNRHSAPGMPARPVCFTAFMLRKYFRADCGHYIRIILAVTAVIVLYVPVSYLIHTDISVQQAKLHQKYGIQYHYVPRDFRTMTASLEECQGLADADTDADAVVCVRLTGRASVQSSSLSRELLDILNDAGWDGQKLWTSDSEIYLLDDVHYGRYLHSCTMTEAAWDSDKPAAVLVNRYINRRIYQEGREQLFPEARLLDPDRWHGFDENAAGSDVTIVYGMQEMEEGAGQYIRPELLLHEVPEGIDFTGDITVILPLSRLEEICASMEDFGGAEVYGCFEDTDRELFDRLRQELDSDGMGRLVYTRKVFQDWYDSMKEIHLTMTSICGTLFFIALLNIFSTMIFQYFGRKRGLAVLWSLGQTEMGLFRILVLENIRIMVISVIAGVPVSCALCYYIYGIFRSVWRIGYLLPAGQIVWILAAAVLTSAAAVVIEYLLMRRQDFLHDIRNFT